MQFLDLLPLIPFPFLSENLHPELDLGKRPGLSNTYFSHLEKEFQDRMAKEVRLTICRKDRMDRGFPVYSRNIFGQIL
jgi:hypothetical protein